MNFNKECTYEEHQGEDNIGFCFHQDCEEEPEFCYLCLQDRQQTHMSDCFRFKQLLDKIQESQAVLNNLKISFKNQYEQLLQQLQNLSSCIVNEEAKLVEFISIIKNKDYDEVKLRWNEFRYYVKNLKTDDFARNIIDKLNTQIEQIHQIVDEYFHVNERNEQLYDLNQISESIVIKQYIPSNKNQQQELQSNDEERQNKAQQQNQYYDEEQNKFNQIQEQNKLQIKQQNEIVKENQKQHHLQDFHEQDLEENDEYLLSQYNIQIAQDLINQVTPLIKSKNYNGAMQILEESFAYDKQNDEAYYLLSKTLLKLKKYSDALKQINICLQLNSKFEEAYYVKGQILEKLDRQEEAVICFQKAENNPKYINDKFYLRIGKLKFQPKAKLFIDLKEASQAIKYSDQAIKFEVNNPNAYNTKAIALEALGQYNSALQNYDRAMQLNSQHPSIYMNKGTLLQKMGRQEETLQCFNQAIQYGKFHGNYEVSQVYEQKIQLLIQMKKYEDALVCVNEMIYEFPQNQESYQLKITILKHLNRHDEAKVISNMMINGQLF